MISQNSKILCFGEVLWDCLPAGKKPGGAPMNVALHLLKFGLDVSMLSKIGNDTNGTELISFLQKSGLNTKFIQIDKQLLTSEVKVHLGDQNHVEYEICEPVAWDNIQYDYQIDELIKETGIIVYGSLAARKKETAKTLHRILENDSFKVMDVNLRPPYIDPEVVIPLMEKADLIKLNEHEIVTISGWESFKSTDEKTQLEWIASRFKCKTVCLTKGDKGASMLIDGSFYQHNGYKVNAIDTVGSGDAFLAGAMYSIINNFSPDKILNFACATGALVATRQGATPDYKIGEIEAFLK